MCILCVVQKWSRRVATMLPWLVIPLIGFWAVSQLLPPGFRFEITSPRLACVLVLLVTLFWYEVLMPQLSAWRARRSSRLRELRQLEAMELQKLRRTATRRCRNCHMPYRDQNPGGGRFMCSYCGHISKRPVLDIPEPAVLGIANSGLGKIWNVKLWSENGWICGHEWDENGHCATTFAEKSSYLGKNGTGISFSCSGNNCSSEKSYFGFVVHSCNLLSHFFFSVRWLWRKIFRISSSQEDDLSDPKINSLISKKGENCANYHESRGEKARRKAEEKRLARLEKELLEEEERKQREEVAKLVEEQRRLRDEHAEAEKELFKCSTSNQERCNGSDAECRKLEKKKEKDVGSSKSNSDGEDHEGKYNGECGKKHELDKRYGKESRDVQKTAGECVRASILDMGNSTKNNVNSFSRDSGSNSRYFDHMKGSLLSSSKAFNGARFFGRAPHVSATTNSKMNKPAGLGVNVQSISNREELCSSEHSFRKLIADGNDSIGHTPSYQHVGSDLQSYPVVQKKSWQQLFTCPPIKTALDANNPLCQWSQSQISEAQSPPSPDQSQLNHQLDKHIYFGLTFPDINSPLSSGSMKSGSVSPLVESTFPFLGSPNDFISEEAELFEDPCYVPDPESLLGPVSKSLDDFSLDIGTGFIASSGLGPPHDFKKLSTAANVNRPAPIESPVSRSRIAEEKLIGPPTQSSMKLLPLDDSGNAIEQKTWQMWETPPLVQDGLGLSGGTASWLSSLGQNRLNQPDILRPSSQEHVMSQFSTESHVIDGTYPPQRAHIDSYQNGGSFNTLGHTSCEDDLWPQKTVFQPLSADQENSFSVNFRKDLSKHEQTRDNPRNRAAVNHFGPSSPDLWSRTAVPGEVVGGVGDSTLVMPHVSLFSTPDVHSLWSFN